MLEDYFTGYEFEYRPFYQVRGTGEYDGRWEFDKAKPDKIIIHYNKLCPPHRQISTQVHELFHFAQFVDFEVIGFFEDLRTNSLLPEELVRKLVERCADKATAMYLMPNTYFRAKYDEIRIKNSSFQLDQLRELAAQFQVSTRGALLRLNECGLVLNTI